MWQRKKEREVELSNSRPLSHWTALNGAVELSGHSGKEVEEGGEGLRLDAQRKSPRVMRKIINHHQIIFITRHAEYRRCPQRRSLGVAAEGEDDLVPPASVGGRRVDEDGDQGPNVLNIDRQ